MMVQNQLPGTWYPTTTTTTTTTVPVPIRVPGNYRTYSVPVVVVPPGTSIGSVRANNSIVVVLLRKSFILVSSQPPALARPILAI
jgi:hypothetical protein